MVGSTRAKYTSYMNGDWVPATDLKIDVSDRGFKVGDTVYDVTRTFNGKSFKLKEHVDRLDRSLKYTRIDPGMSPEEEGDFSIRQIITRGPGRWASTAGSPTVIIEIGPNVWDAAPFYERGAHCVIARTRSYTAESVDPKIKHHSRMNFNLADLEAKDVDPQAWPVLTDTDGNLTEGVGYNLFLVTDGVIRSPGDSAILQGVSRARSPTWRLSSTYRSSTRPCSRMTSTPPTRLSSLIPTSACCPLQRPTRARSATAYPGRSCNSCWPRGAS